MTTILSSPHFSTEVTLSPLLSSTGDDLRSWARGVSSTVGKVRVWVRGRLTAASCVEQGVEDLEKTQSQVTLFVQSLSSPPSRYR